jgi:hypothetical protein
VFAIEEQKSGVQMVHLHADDHGKFLSGGVRLRESDTNCYNHTFSYSGSHLIVSAGPTRESQPGNQLKQSLH